jgi:hypothetical protein
LTPRLRIASAAYAYLSARAANADLLQGRDTTTLSRSTHNHDATYVNEAQANSVTGAMLVDGTVKTADVGDTAVTMAKLAKAGATTGEVIKWTGAVWEPGPDNTGGGSGVTNVYQDTGITCVPNPITTTGNVKLNLTYSDTRYVNEAQANSVTGAMITDGQVSSADIRDTTVNTAELKDGAVTSAKILDANVTSADIRDTTVNTAKLKDAAVTAPKLNQMGATTNQVLKWTGSAWAPRNDSIGGGSGDSAWVRAGTDSVLYTIRRLGIAKGGTGNKLYGNQAYTHVNLGDACTTGMSGNNAFAATVAGGSANVAGGHLATIGGGTTNRASGNQSAVCGGGGNIAGGTNSFVGSGWGNTANGNYASVGSGQHNHADFEYATVGGGFQNTAGELYATVGGGLNNSALDTSSCIAGGEGNTVDWTGGFIGGGYGNRAELRYSTIGGGYGDTTYGNYSVIGGGYDNAASGDYASILGGNHNVTSGTGTGAISGRNNLAGGTGGDAVVAGGYANTAYGSSAAVGGGTQNYSFADDACVPGGRADSATANYSFATNYHSVVGGSFTNSACFNSEYVTSANQVRCANLSVSGAKSFTIDHPTDPTGKILNHYSVESPEMLVEYRGKANIGADGRVVVTLPEYFDALSREPMVQLTGVGTFEVYVAEKVEGNGFVIGGKPGTEVYWTVTGDRDDQSARIGRILMPVEQPKTGVLAGRMLDDDYLVGSKAQLDRLGQGTDFRFRTAEGQRLYGQMKQMTKQQ